MVIEIIVPPSLMDILWDSLSPAVLEWLTDNNIAYHLDECDANGRMILTLGNEFDATAFKLRWL